MATHLPSLHWPATALANPMRLPTKDAACLWLVLISQTDTILARGSAPLAGTHFVHLRKSDATRRYTRILTTGVLRSLDVFLRLNSLI